MILTFYRNENSKEPIYMELYEYLKEKIIQNNIKDGEKLPSIREASKMFKLSKTTIKNAYFQLLTEGYIINKPRQGYYAVHLSDFQVKSKKSLNTNFMKSKDFLKTLYKGFV
jgi:GntR family transcriptional regulator/MocR family aminotransferase